MKLININKLSIESNSARENKKKKIYKINFFYFRN